MREKRNYSFVLRVTYSSQPHRIVIGIAEQEFSAENSLYSVEYDRIHRHTRITYSRPTERVNTIHRRTK